MAIEEISNEMKAVKESLESAVHSTSQNIETNVTNMADKINNTTVDDIMKSVSETSPCNLKDNTAEAVSEAETVLVSEAENLKDVTSNLDSRFEAFEEVKNNFGEPVQTIKDPIVEMLDVEDVEESMEIIDNCTPADFKNFDTNITSLITHPVNSPIKSPKMEISDKAEE